LPSWSERLGRITSRHADAGSLTGLEVGPELQQPGNVSVTVERGV
jgi:hypothetical protein